MKIFYFYRSILMTGFIFRQPKRPNGLKYPTNSRPATVKPLANLSGKESPFPFFSSLDSVSFIYRDNTPLHGHSLPQGKPFRFHSDTAFKPFKFQSFIISSASRRHKEIDRRSLFSKNSAKSEDGFSSKYSFACKIMSNTSKS